MSSAVEFAQAGMGCWFTGGLNGPEKEVNFDKYFSEDIVWENNLGISAPSLKEFDSTFNGRSGFWRIMEMFNVIEWRDMKPTFFQGPAEDKVMIMLEGFVGVRGTDKVSEKRVEALVQWTIKDGKCVHIKDFGSDVHIWNDVFA
jgi:hypothetical protein